MQVLYQRCAAVDIGTDAVAVAVRLPGDGPEGRATVKRTFNTFYGVLAEAARWLTSLGVTHVAVEATGIYSRPACHALTGHGDFGQVLVRNAGHVKNVPGRKTGLADADWLVHLLECGLLAGGFIAPAGVKAARGVFRYRPRSCSSGSARPPGSAACSKTPGSRPGSAASPVAAKTGRAMTGALTGGERRGPVLAQLAKGKIRSKIPDLPVALEGRFGGHHALMCRLHLDHTGHLEAGLQVVVAVAAPAGAAFAGGLVVCGAQPGPGGQAGVGGEVFPDVGAGLADHPGGGELPDAGDGGWQVAGGAKGRHHRLGLGVQLRLAGCAWSAVRHDRYLKSHYHRHVIKFGGYRSQAAKKKAITVVAHAVIVIIWHILATGKPYDELGSDYFTSRLDPERETRRLIAKLEAPGHTVTLQPTAA